MIWILAIVGLIGVGIIVAWFRGRRQTEEPISLASRVLRHPERVLIDIPQVVSSGDAAEGCKLLLEAEAELGHVGALHMRRQLLTRFAEVFQAPSRDSVKGLTDFLFHTADQEFQDILSWERRCAAPMRFLRLLHAMIESVESERLSENTKRLIPKNRLRLNDVALKRLKGNDRDIAKEWFLLFLGLSEVISPEKANEKSKSSKKSRSKQAGGLGKGTSAADPPKRLADPNTAPHLRAFQRVAGEVSVQYINLTLRDTPGKSDLTV